MRILVQLFVAACVLSGVSARAQDREIQIGGGFTYLDGSTGSEFSLTYQQPSMLSGACPWFSGDPSGVGFVSRAVKNEAGNKGSYQALYANFTFDRTVREQVPFLQIIPSYLYMQMKIGYGTTVISTGRDTKSSGLLISPEVRLRLPWLIVNQSFSAEIYGGYAKTFSSPQFDSLGAGLSLIGRF